MLNSKRVWIFVAAVLSSLLAIAPLAHAQLPTATGRSITMSDARWQLFIPSTYKQRGNVADIIVHFHGDSQTFWNNARWANQNAIIVTVNYNGLSSAYTTPFASNTSLFQNILNEALTDVRNQLDFPDTLQWDKVAVSSFSAGYGAVREILKSPAYRNEINALLTADSLYASTGSDGTPLDSQMADYKTFASLAKSGSKTFIFSHSQVPTSGYESTVDTANELMQSLGISATTVSGAGLGTLGFYRHATTGNFDLWGATGSDGDSHLEHLRYIGQFLQELPLATTVPEPATLGAVILVAPMMLRRRRHR